MNVNYHGETNKKMQLEKNQKLEKLAQIVVQKSQLSADETEKIVSSPDLYQQIRARIEAKQAMTVDVEQANANKYSARFFDKWKLFARPRFAIAVLSCGLVCAIALIIGQSLVFDSVRNFLTAGSSALTRINDFPSQSNQVSFTEPQTEELASVSENEERVGVKRSIKKTIDVKKIKFIGAPKTKERQLPDNNLMAARPKSIEPKKDVVLPSTSREFYPLAFANDLETTESKQIVRVELSPVALRSLGVLAPPNYVEQNSGNNFITADLLLGEDGTPRAIRFVN